MRVRGCGWPKSPVFVSMSKDSKALRTETVKAMPAEIRMDPAIWSIWKDEAMKMKAYESYPFEIVRICSPPLSKLSGHEAALRGCWALSGASKLCREKTWKDSKILKASLGLLIRLLYLRILESTVSFIFLIDLWSFLISLEPSFPSLFRPFLPFLPCRPFSHLMCLSFQTRLSSLLRLNFILFLVVGQSTTDSSSLTGSSVRLGCIEVSACPPKEA